MPTIAFDERREATFAERPLLSCKPKLQAMGLALVEITLQLSLVKIPGLHK